MAERFWETTLMFNFNARLIVGISYFALHYSTTSAHRFSDNRHHAERVASTRDGQLDSGSNSPQGWTTASIYVAAEITLG